MRAGRACAVALAFGALLALAPAAQALQSWNAGKIAFISSRGGNSDLFLMKADGSHERNLTEDSPQGEDTAAVSPNGKRLAFLRYNGQDSELWVMPASGGKARRLTTNLAYERTPVWSPDGKRLAFSRGNMAGSRLYVMSLKNRRARALTDVANSLSSPTFAPDGKRIAFARSEDGTQSDIHSIRLDGTHERNLTRTPGLYEYSPAWSPDGKRFAIQNDAGDITLISARTGQELPGAAPFDGNSPSWSPSGKKLSYAFFDGTDSDIYSARPNGTQVKNLTDNSFSDYLWD